MVCMQRLWLMCGCADADGLGGRYMVPSSTYSVAGQQLPGHLSSTQHVLGCSLCRWLIEQLSLSGLDSRADKGRHARMLLSLRQHAGMRHSGQRGCGQCSARAGYGRCHMVARHVPHRCRHILSRLWLCASHGHAACLPQSDPAQTQRDCTQLVLVFLLFYMGLLNNL